MTYSISVRDKKHFIQWFLKNYHPKKRESIWILNYLLNHQDVLRNLHFVPNVKNCPRGIVISTKCSNKVAFQFYKKHLVTADPDKAFHDIRLHPDEPIYIQLNFFKSYQSAAYAFVLEDNPFTSKELQVTLEDKQVAKNILQKTLDTYKVRSLKREIDIALDEMDQAKFIQLTNELKELDSKNDNQPKMLSH